MKTVLIGAVGSTKVVLNAMIETGFPVTHVFSLDEEISKNVSGYYPIHNIAEDNQIHYTKFKQINDDNNIEIIRGIEPDYIFVVGLSQLVGKKIIDCAKKGVVGFHPTPLPKMRGRAANVWQVLLGVHETKCSMFFIDDGMDSGDILGQEDYIIEDTDYAIDVYNKIEQATYKLTKRVLKQILDGTLVPQKQNEEEATYLLKRTPEDGQINWDEPIENIHRLIRAVSYPFPGAFGMYDGKHQLIIWRAEIQNNNKYIGMNGQIAQIANDTIDVVCSNGILHITEFENVDKVKLLVGHKLR